MKKLFVAIAFLLVLFILSGCANNGENEHKTTNVMIRYFDGSSEMLILDHYEVGKCTFHLYTVDGSEIITSPYNAIIIKESCD